MDAAETPDSAEAEPFRVFITANEIGIRDEKFKETMRFQEESVTYLNLRRTDMGLHTTSPNLTFRERK